LIKGSLEMRGGSAKVIGNDIIPMWKVREQMVKSLTVRMPSEDLALEQVEQLEALATAHRGQCKLYFDLITGDDPRPCRVLSRTVVIDPNEEVMRGLAKIFGRRAVMVEGDK